MSGKIITSALSGFMELLPSEQIVFNKIFQIIRESYENFGFVPIDTPVLERSDVLLAKAGGETEKQIFKFVKGDVEHAMRFDLTVPLARYVAEHYPELTFPFKRYAMGKVYRGERPQAGRFREFYQCDIDVIGDEVLDLRFDAELPSIINTIFKKLGFTKFKIRINNRKILNGLFSGIGATQQSKSIMQSIDRLEKIGLEAVRQELSGLGLNGPEIQKVVDFVSLTGSSDDILQGLRGFGIDDEDFKAGVEELAEVVKLVRQFGVNESNFKVDLSIARGLDYYTGTVYETMLTDFPDIGSVCSGGRYDELASHYTDRKLPGVGVSIGLTRLFDQLKKKEVLTFGPSSPTEVIILPMTEDMSYALSLATQLRESGIPTEVSFVSGKMKKQLNYARKLGIPYVVFIGEEEISSNSYTLKDFGTGEQQVFSKNDLLSKIKNERTRRKDNEWLDVHN